MAPESIINSGKKFHMLEPFWNNVNGKRNALLKHSAQLFFAVFLDLLPSDFFKNMRVHTLFMQCMHNNDIIQLYKLVQKKKEKLPYRQFILNFVIWCYEKQQKWKNKTKLSRYEIYITSHNHPSISSGFLDSSSATHSYYWVERGTVRVKCRSRTQHNDPARTRTRTFWSGVKHANH